MSKSSIKNQGSLLAINFGGIGDEILFLPTLRTIRAALPDWKVTLLLEPRSKSFSDLTDLIDSTITFDIKKKPLLPSDMLKLLNILREGRYDIVLSSGSSMMVSLLLTLSQIPVKIGFNSNKLASTLLTRATPLDQTVYAGRMYHSLAEGLADLANHEVSQGEDLFIPEIKTKTESLERMKDFFKRNDIDLENASQNLVLIHPGTSKLATIKGIIKTWSSKNWAELIKRLSESTLEKNTKVVLAGGPDDLEIIDEIKALTPDLNYLTASGETKNLNDLAALIELSDLFVCVDSAPMHLAVALKKPVVALFGPTTPALLVPENSLYTTIWDTSPGTRSMFDGLGVNLDIDTVFGAIEKKLSAPSLL